MEIKVNGFFIPHNGESHYSCADSIAVNSQNYAIAIADGVGGSFDPRFLSRHITQDFVDNPLLLFDTKSFTLKKDYQSLFDNYCMKRYDTLSESEKMCWDLQKESKGASSECTFVGCAIENGVWRYIALGDSYLFFVDKDGHLLKISSMLGREFDVHPEYFSTTGKTKGKFITGTIPLQEGALLMMTDALSEWFVKYYEKDPSILSCLLNLNNHTDYQELCEKELAENHMHDDDCALLIARISNNDSKEILFETNYMDTFEKISITTIELVSKQNMSLKEQVENLQQENQFLQKQLATYTNQNVTKDEYPPIEESLNTELTSTPKQIVEEFQENNADISSKIESEGLEKMGDKPIESDGVNKATECMENQRAAIGSKKKIDIKILYMIHNIALVGIFVELAMLTCLLIIIN